MPLTINANLHALSAQRGLGMGERGAATAIQRLSSGMRINSAKDDAAGLAISQRMTSLVRGMDQAARNANDGISMAQTMDGALQSKSGIIQRLRELAVQSANASNQASDRKALNQEAAGLLVELDRIARSTEFNGQNLLDGSLGTSNFQVGAHANQTISTAGLDLRTSSYGMHQTNGNDGGGIAAQYAAWGANGITAGTLSIAGYNGSATVNVGANQSARTIAEAINAASSSTGVTATAKTTARLAFAAPSGHTLTIRSSNANPVTIYFNMTSTQPDGYEEVAAAFNQVADKTGVTAKTFVMSTGLTRVLLTNDNGDDIQLSDAGISSELGTGVTKFVEDTSSDVLPSISLLINASIESIVTSGSLALRSSSAFSVNSTTNAYVAGQSVSAFTALSALDLSTATSSQTAIRLADAALQSVNAHRAKLGAVMSRFESAVGHLKVSSENMSAARGRVEDADFAVETANWSRAQILQTAANAIVAQANQLPAGVLKLLI